jgi:predicted naringenin-chalcone synthase
MTVIASIGAAVPKHSMAQTDAAEMAVSLTTSQRRRQQAVGTLYRRAGVGRRHCVVLNASTNGVPAEQDFFRPAMDDDGRGPTTARRMRRYARNVAPLALEAARNAFDRAEIAPQEITHLVTATCTGFSSPGFDISLLDNLPLPRTVERVQVGYMGCHAALNALRVARAFASSDPATRVLVCAAELCSLHFQYKDDPQTIVSNALFADGAAAAIVTGEDSRCEPQIQNRSPQAWRLAASGSVVLPDTTDAMSWTIGNHGFEMRLSPQVPGLILDHLAPWLDRWLASHNMRREQIASWAVHPGGPRILQATAEALALPPHALDASWRILHRYGNMSSPTILFILEELRRTEAQLPAVALAFGPGLTIEAALIT